MTHRTMLNRLVFMIGAVLSFVMTIAGQQIEERHPDPDSHDLYISFFFFSENFAKWTTERMTAEPSRKTQILNSSVKYLGIQPTEFPAFQGIISDTCQRLRLVGEEANSFVQARKATQTDVDGSMLMDFQNRRKLIIQAAVGNLKQSLSQLSWQRVAEYVNGEHRKHVSISPSINRR